MFSSPAGTTENSPPFQRRVQIGNGSSPAGAADPSTFFSAVPAGLDFIFSVLPPLKRRAIFGRHFVTSDLPHVFGGAFPIVNRHS